VGAPPGDVVGEDIKPPLKGVVQVGLGFLHALPRKGGEQNTFFLNQLWAIAVENGNGVQSPRQGADFLLADDFSVLAAIGDLERGWGHFRGQGWGC
jgi:hypothetical protein